MLYNTVQHRWTRIVLAVVGSFIYAVGINYFITPAGLYTGGFLGVGQIIRTLLVTNLGLDFGGKFRSISGHFGLKSMLCTVCNTVFLSVLVPPAEPILYDVLAASILGGVIAGVGIGLMLYDGGSSGGTDILGVFLMKKFPGISVGRANMAFNITLYAVCLLLFNVQVAIYSIIYAVFSALVVDRLHQQNIVVMVLIFTKKKDDALRQYVTQTLHRSVTYWDGTGAYSNSPTDIMCICLSKYELEELRHAMNTLDPEAFMVVDEGVHIHGHYIKRL